MFSRVENSPEIENTSSIAVFTFKLKSFFLVNTECKYGVPLGQPGSSYVKARLVRPQEFCFDCVS